MGTAGAGNDDIVWEGYDETDHNYVAGEAYTAADGTTALADNKATADGGEGHAQAGNDSIEGEGTTGDRVAGEALTAGDDALADSDNEATASGDGEASAGSDEIQLDRKSTRLNSSH